MTYWVLTVNPADFRVEEYLLDKDEGLWRSGRHHIRAGDRVAFWKCKGKGPWCGIIGFGEVLTNPEVRPLPEEDLVYWREGAERGRECVPRVCIRFFPLSIPMRWESGSPVLAELAEATGRIRGVRKPDEEQWERLLEETGGWLGE